MSICLKCKKNLEKYQKKFCSISCQNLFYNEKRKLDRIQDYNQSPNQCQNCQKNLPYDKRNNKYCSRSCSAKVNNKIPNRKHGPSKSSKSNRLWYSKVDFITCKITGRVYCNRNSKGNYRKKSPYIKTKKEKYYNEAAFKFNVYNYPNEFDLDLLLKFGWYSTPGSRNGIKNSKGISRDHTVSIQEGFEKGYDPKILSHPANCRLVQHKDNSKKWKRSDMSYAELKQKIKNWNKRYKI